MNRKDEKFMNGLLLTRDEHIYTHMLRHIRKIFHTHGEKLEKVQEMAKQFNRTIKETIPLIEPVTQAICPSCQNICCVRKNGFFTKEDLIYLSALDITPPTLHFDGKDEEPCQFLSQNGCVLDRSLRPSGCNWFFCDALLEYFEKTEDYHTFEDSFSRLAELWLQMIEAFSLIEHGFLKQ